jgi:Ca-activated chloride channel family protein
MRRRSRAGAFLASLSYLALASFIVALARPQLGSEITRVQASGVDIMLLLDVSRSMLSEDFSIGSSRASRIEVVKKVTEQFIRKRPNDRMGIIAFAGRPYLVSPLTLDHDWLIQNLDRTRIGLVEDGTAIGSAIASGANRLKDKEAKTKLIVLLTDGDNNAGKVMPLTAAEAAKALGIRIYTIGAGTKGEAPFPFTDPFGRTVYRNVPVDFKEDTIRDIAKIANGIAYRATDTKSLEKIFGEIDKLEKSKVEVEKIAQYRDLFPWFLVAGLACLGAQILLSQTLWRRLP